MRIPQASIVKPELAEESKKLGEMIARLRIARGVKQTEAALRASLSRNTAYRLEKGDPAVAIGQILRYINAIAPGITLIQLVTESDPALTALKIKEQRQRVRGLSAEQLREVDF